MLPSAKKISSEELILEVFINFFIQERLAQYLNDAPWGMSNHRPQVHHTWLWLVKQNPPFCSNHPSAAVTFWVERWCRQKTGAGKGSGFDVQQAPLIQRAAASPTVWKPVRNAVLGRKKLQPHWSKCKSSLWLQEAQNFTYEVPTLVSAFTEPSLACETRSLQFLEKHGSLQIKARRFWWFGPKPQKWLKAELGDFQWCDSDENEKTFIPSNFSLKWR